MQVYNVYVKYSHVSEWRKFDVLDTSTLEVYNAEYGMYFDHDHVADAYDIRFEVPEEMVYEE